MNNKIIIVGGNHHNGLGLARIFGLHGYNVVCVLINQENNNFLKYSKYVSSSVVFSNEKDAFDYVLSTFKSPEKAVLIPYSDGAALELDSRLNEFTPFFYVPSINGTQGAISELMHKDKQYTLAKEYNIKMAKTWLIDLSEGIVDNNIYPLIIKPNISAEGDKKDIEIVSTYNEYIKALDRLKSKNYNSVLVQEYLDIDYEIDVFGCICRNYPKVVFVPSKTIRSWPPNGGTNSFSEIIIDEDIIRKIKDVISILPKIGFYGLYDIELFVVNNEVWLNEINFRNSGDVYMCLHQSFYYPMVWVNDIFGIDNSNSFDHPQNKCYVMTEWADIRHVFYKKYSIFKWLQDYKKCADYALKYEGDTGPARAWRKYYLKKIIDSIFK